MKSCAIFWLQASQDKFTNHNLYTIYFGVCIIFIYTKNRKASSSASKTHPILCILKYLDSIKTVTFEASKISLFISLLYFLSQSDVAILLAQTYVE